jgi:hypothetical protein
MTIRCIRCGKLIKGEARMVQMRIDGTLWTARHAPALEERENQGWFEVGSDCYRKVGAAGPVGIR